MNNQDANHKIEWRPLEPGLNLDFSDLHAAPYMTGAPSKGWVLYSRRGGACWNTLTEREFAPEPGMIPKRSADGWRWINPMIGDETPDGRRSGHAVRLADSTLYWSTIDNFIHPHEATAYKRIRLYESRELAAQRAEWIESFGMEAEIVHRVEEW